MKIISRSPEKNYHPEGTDDLSSDRETAGQITIFIQSHWVKAGEIEMKRRAQAKQFHQAFAAIQPLIAEVKKRVVPIQEKISPEMIKHAAFILKAIQEGDELFSPGMAASRDFDSEYRQNMPDYEGALTHYRKAMARINQIKKAQKTGELKKAWGEIHGFGYYHFTLATLYLNAIESLYELDHDHERLAKYAPAYFKEAAFHLGELQKWLKPSTHDDFKVRSRAVEGEVEDISTYIGGLRKSYFNALKLRLPGVLNIVEEMQNPSAAKKIRRGDAAKNIEVRFTQKEIKSNDVLLNILRGKEPRPSRRLSAEAASKMKKIYDYA